MNTLFARLSKITMRGKILALYAVLALLLAACGGGSGGSGSEAGVNPPPPPPTANNEDVESVLQSFGIDIAESPRKDADGNELPADYAPLGGKRTINKFDEVMVFGSGFAPRPAQGEMPIIDISPEAGNRYSSELLHNEPLNSSPWFASSDMARSAAAADVDGDGLDEIIIVYQERGEPVHLVVLQDEAENFALSEPMLIDLEDRDQLFLAPGDFNGDSRVDIMVGLVTYGADSSLVMLENEQGTLMLNSQQVQLPRTSGIQTHLALSTGNLDYDVAVELGVVINESEGEMTDGRGGAGDKSQGTARYYVLDDANSDFAELLSGPVAIDTGSEIVRAVVADIAFGDVDGDTVDEIILGGLDEMNVGRSLDNGEPAYLLTVLDDAERSFQRLVGDRRSSGANALNPNASGADHWLMYLHIATADIDGDGAKEIVSNQYVYEDLRDAGYSLLRYDDGSGPVEIPAGQFINNGGRGSAGNYFFSWANSDLAVGDVTSDKRENIVIFSDAQQELLVWGHDQIDGWKEMLTRDVVPSSSFVRPVVLAADVELDKESMALEYSGGAYRYVLTEPVIIAALAAAPCSESLGQDLTSCRTAFGHAVSESESREKGWSLSAGVSAGFAGSVPFLGSAEAVASAQRTARNYSNSNYTVTKSILRQTGPIEDSVLFYSVPMDIYTYKVLSHPNPDLIGQDLEVRYPREPITIMTPRETYNANVQDDALKVDERVFQHQPGDHRSYPSVAVKNQLLGTYDGLESGSFDVDATNGGITTVTITEFESTTRGRSFSYERSLDVKTTGVGLVAGFKVGNGSDSAVEITRGTEVTYQGTVGHIDVAFLPDGLYKTGLFAYIYDADPDGQVFEVLNYWVD